MQDAECDVRCDSDARVYVRCAIESEVSTAELAKENRCARSTCMRSLAHVPCLEFENRDARKWRTRRMRGIHNVGSVHAGPGSESQACEESE